MIDPGQSMNPFMLDPELREQIIREIRQFTEKWLGFSPNLVSAAGQETSLAVTMTHVLAQAEVVAAKSKAFSELIMKNHVWAFKSVRKLLETKISEITGKTVTGSSLMLDTESNCAALVFTFL